MAIDIEWVKENWENLQFIEEQTEEMCWEALKQSQLAMWVLPRQKTMATILLGGKL